MSVARIKTHFLGWRDWELNPIVLKELRQAVRSWAVTGMLLLFLLALFVVAMVFLVTQSFQVEGNDQLGEGLFAAFLLILAVAGIVFIPLYTGVRVAAERQDSNPDLLYISTLSPGRIIRGKFFCAAYVTLLFFSACLPFMALTNLLRGVDLPTVFFLLAFLFVLTCGVNLAAIFIACLPISKLFKIVMGLAGFVTLFFLLSWVMMAAFEMLRSGVGAMLFQRQFWETTGTYLFLAAAAGGLFYVLSVALISPGSANRALLPRVYITLLWLFGGVLAGYASFKLSDSEIILIWTFLSSVLIILALIVTISNQDQLSVRVRRAIPMRHLPRMLAFCYYNGAAGGLVWVAVLTGLTYVGTRVFWSVGPGVGSGPSYATVISNTSESINSFTTIYPPMALYFFAYALFALFIQRRFLPRLAPKLAGILAVFITALTALATNIFLFFTNQLSWKAADHLELGNAFNLMSEHDARQQTTHLICAFSLLVIALVLNAKWFFTQWKQFTPPAGSNPVPAKLD